MNVILLERIRNLGEIGDQVSVKPGYGRNFLVPTNKAVPATPANIEYFEAKRAELEKAQQERLDAAKKRAAGIDGSTVTINAKASDEGKLYGSITALEIVDALKSVGHDVEKSEVQLPEGPFRVIGNYEIQLHFNHGDVIATVNVAIEAE